MRRSSGLKRTQMRRKPRPRAPLSDIPRQAFRAAARAQRACAVTGSTGPWDAHHVIERGHLKRTWPDHEWSPENALRLSKRVHERHTTATERVPLRCLTDENLAFAVGLMGVAAHGYLTRRYAGHDERLELLIAELGAPDACG